MIRRRYLATVLLLGITSTLLASNAPRVRLSREKMRDVIVRKVEPQYPPQAVPSSLEGPVVVAVVISQTGSVIEAEPKCGHPILAASAVDAVRHWQFRSVAVAGKPVEIQGEVVLDFEAPNRPASPTLLQVPSQLALTHLVSSAPPTYPSDAALGRIQGCVIVRSLIGVDGRVRNVKVISGHPMLGRAAEVSAAQSRYQPFTKDGAVVEAETYQIVDFSLRN